MICRSYFLTATSTTIDGSPIQSFRACSVHSFFEKNTAKMLLAKINEISKATGVGSNKVVVTSFNRYQLIKVYMKHVNSFLITLLAISVIPCLTIGLGLVFYSTVWLAPLMVGVVGFGVLWAIIDTIVV